MPYLDIVRRVKDQFGVPTFVYQVSGETRDAHGGGAQMGGWTNVRWSWNRCCASDAAWADGIPAISPKRAAQWLND